MAMSAELWACAEPTVLIRSDCDSRPDPGSGSKRSDPAKVAFFVSAALAAVPYVKNSSESPGGGNSPPASLPLLDAARPLCNPQYFQQVPLRFNEPATSRQREVANSRHGKDATTLEHKGWRAFSPLRQTVGCSMLAT